MAPQDAVGAAAARPGEHQQRRRPLAGPPETPDDAELVGTVHGPAADRSPRPAAAQHRRAQSRSVEPTGRHRQFGRRSQTQGHRHLRRPVEVPPVGRVRQSGHPDPAGMHHHHHRMHHH